MELIKLISNNNPDEVVLDYINNNIIDIKERCSMGNTALILCCNRNYVKSVEKLLNLGACPNVSNYHGISPLIYPCQDGSIEIIKMLLEKGANVEHRTSVNNTALHMACKYLRLEALMLLIPYVKDMELFSELKEFVLSERAVMSSKGYYNEKERLVKSIEIERVLNIFPLQIKLTEDLEKKEVSLVLKKI